MNRLKTLSASALFLLLGLAVPAIALQEKQEENAKPPKQEQPAKPEKQEQAKPQKQEQPKPEKQEQAKPAKQTQAKPQQEAKAPKQEQRAKPEKQAQAKPEKQEQANPQTQPKQQQPKTQQQAKTQQQPRQQSASSHGAPQRTQQDTARQHAQPALHLSARGSGRIPDDHFRSSFGSGHNFHMGNPVIVGGYSRFQYGGYWFGFVDPWPADWYYTDDFYIDYVDGGYYMYNPYYPGARFAITVVI
jgi:primosomal protein N'